MLAFHPLHHRTPRFNSILCIFYNFFGLRMFPAPQDLMPQFIFIYTPQILDHFHFISYLISILFFVLSSFTWLLSLRWIFTIFPTREARLGLCIFVYLQSGSPLFELGLELIKTSLRRSTSYTLVSFLFCFPPHTYLIFIWFLRSILTTVIHGEFYGIFTNPSPSNDVFLHFTLESRPSVTIHFFSRALAIIAK